jgi:tetratricopeptide (TPR) repeat protein
MLAMAALTGLLFAQMPGLCDSAQSAALAEDARRAVSRRQFDTAVSLYRQSTDACPQNRGLLTEMANALFMAGRFADAASTASSVLSFDRGNADALKIKGNAQYFSGQFGQAIDTFITLLDRHPKDEEGAYMLGRIYYQEGHIDQAIGQFERALRLNPKAYKAWDNLGLCWQSQGNNDKAIAHFLRAISLVEKEHPEYDWAYANLADLLVQTGDADRAFAAAAKAANRNTNSARNFYIGAKALDKLGKTELCLNWAQRSAALDPTYSEAQYLLAKLYHRLGQEDKAEAARKAFLELKAKEPGKRR